MHTQGIFNQFFCYVDSDIELNDQSNGKSIFIAQTFVK